LKNFVFRMAIVPICRSTSPRSRQATSPNHRRRHQRKPAPNDGNWAPLIRSTPLVRTSWPPSRRRAQGPSSMQSIPRHAPGVIRAAADAVWSARHIGPRRGQCTGRRAQLRRHLDHERRTRGAGHRCGRCRSPVFIPQLVALHAEGRFPFDRLIRFYPFEDINEAASKQNLGEIRRISSVKT
jgi:hypothetical protein